MEPGLAMLSSRAAILIPSPIKSPSLSSTTSPTWTPIRNSMRRSGGNPALRSTMPCCTSIAQRTASTALRNSTSAPSPVRLTTRPLCTEIVGSIRSLRSARRRARVRSSSAPVSRLNPTTSAARIAASFRFSLMPASSPRRAWHNRPLARRFGVDVHTLCTHLAPSTRYLDAPEGQEMTLRVIGAGVGRTGTNSLRLALNQLGLGPCYHMHELVLNLPVNVPLWLAALNGHAGWDAIYRGYASAVDWPTAGFFRELNAVYPQARFIL